MKRPDEIKQFNIEVTTTLHGELKVAAAQRGMSMRDAVVQAIKTWLSKPPPARRLTDQQIALLEKILFNSHSKADIQLREHLLLLLKQAEE